MTAPALCGLPFRRGPERIRTEGKRRFYDRGDGSPEREMVKIRASSVPVAGFRLTGFCHVSRLGGGVIHRGFMSKQAAARWAWDNGYAPLGIWISGGPTAAWRLLWKEEDADR